MTDSVPNVAPGTGHDAVPDDTVVDGRPAAGAFEPRPAGGGRHRPGPAAAVGRWRVDARAPQGPLAGGPNRSPSPGAAAGPVAVPDPESALAYGAVDDLYRHLFDDTPGPYAASVLQGDTAGYPIVGRRPGPVTAEPTSPSRPLAEPTTELPVAPAAAAARTAQVAAVARTAPAATTAGPAGDDTDNPIAAALRRRPVPGGRFGATAVHEQEFPVLEFFGSESPEPEVSEPEPDAGTGALAEIMAEAVEFRPDDHEAEAGYEAGVGYEAAAGSEAEYGPEPDPPAEVDDEADDGADDGADAGTGPGEGGGLTSLRPWPAPDPNKVRGVLSAPAPRVPHTRVPKTPRRAGTGLAAMVVVAVVAAFFAWVSAEPFWLAVGHASSGTATVTKCTGTGTGRRCLASFADPAGQLVTASVPLVGTATAQERPGVKVAARMVSAEGRAAYAGGRRWQRIGWVPGFALVVLSGLVLAWAGGATRLPTRRTRVAGVLASLAAPVVLLVGIVAANW